MTNKYGYLAISLEEVVRQEPSWTHIEEPSRTLIDNLRNCPANERRDAAFKLARLATDASVKELKRMVEGKRRTIFSHYNIYEQIIGVEALGKSQRLDVLAYLKCIYTPYGRREDRPANPVTGTVPGIDAECTWYEDYWRVKAWRYLNAPKKIAEALYYERMEEPKDQFEKTAIETNMSKFGSIFGGKRISEIHDIFRTAIKTLEEERFYSCDRGFPEEI